MHVQELLMNMMKSIYWNLKKDHPFSNAQIVIIVSNII